MSEWKEYKLGELIKDIAAGPFGSNLKVECFVESGFPIIDGANLKGIRVTDNITKYVTEEKARSLYRAIAKRNDVVVTISGNVGQISYIPDDSKYLEYLVSQRQFRATFDETKVDVPFLVYYFHTRVGQHKILSFANQVGVPALAQPIKNFREIELALPPLDEQKRIAGVLSSLDDKIDLLNRENATLEALAETLFRHYFIENPDPEWKEGKLGELIEVKYGKDHKKLGDGRIPVIGSGGIMRYADKALFDGESVLIPRKGSLDNVMYIDEPFWTVDTMFYTKMKIPNIAKFVYQYMKTLDLVNMNVGSAVPSMTAEVLNNIPLEIPSQTALDDYERVVAPFYKKTKSNQQQMQTLAIQRDTLLPRLMSGEVEVTWQ